jgi:hypothetical protein
MPCSSRFFLSCECAELSEVLREAMSFDLSPPVGKNIKPKEMLGSQLNLFSAARRAVLLSTLFTLCIAQAFQQGLSTGFVSILGNDYSVVSGDAQDMVLIDSCDNFFEDSEATENALQITSDLRLPGHASLRISAENFSLPDEAQLFPENSRAPPVAI